MIALVVVLAVGLAAFTYLWLERLGRRAVVPLACRAIAWSALGLLLLNVGCPVAAPIRRPLVLLDGSLSLTAPGGRWREAHDSAARWGDVRLFGDERGQGSAGDTLPNRGRSLLGPALTAAAAAGRPVVVVSDGEIGDAAELPPDLLAGAAIRLFPRAPASDVAITALTGPARVTRGDSLTLEAEVRGSGDAVPESVTVAVHAGDARLARRTVPLGAAREARVELRVGTAALAPGDHLLRVALAGHRDAEPRTDSRLHLVTVVATPGIVLLAGSADWDTRFLYRALKDVAQLPLRGFERLERNRWRAMESLAPAAEDAVRRAARGADLLILKGGVGAFAAGSRARGIWRWPSGETGTPPVPGDWYLAASAASPLADAFAGVPLDSFPPAIQIAPARSPDPDWVALTGQMGRRGPRVPAVFGRSAGRIREVDVRADGLWRWAFRGGSSEESYRAWVSATVSWLLAGADSARGVARPVRAVVANGRPMVFEWTGAGAPQPTAITWTNDRASPGEPVRATLPRATPRADTLRFDGFGHASVRLPVGEYRYQLAAGGSGMAAVEAYSAELLPGAVTLTPHGARRLAEASRRSARDWPWLFALCIVGLAGEWLARRRMGLR
ncbi:MAG TPA: hypothetical protein VFW66_15535 [Gemmatimonadales bacterium]|nr:hypothetical protein [Gemmatimonadales bacterium]